MYILDKLKSIYNFFIENRKNGTTTLLEQIYNKEDIYVLLVNEQQKDDFNTKKSKKNIITLESIYDKKNIKSLSKKPILIDNYIMLNLLEMAITENEFLTSELYSYIQIINKINTTLDDFNNNKKYKGNINPELKTPVNFKMKF